ncbi:MAG: DUF302 domain-containing protein [Gammaproteobacteria bacterium]|nr:DUF302 domain-containing protein [Gammaproteobacteria bacterium]
MQYEISTTISGNFETAKETLFGILTENQLTVVSDVDVQSTFKAKLDKSIPPYHIYGACNAKLAERVLDAEPEAGALLPCTFVLREDGDNCIVSFMHPENIMGLAKTDAVREVGAIAQGKVEAIIEALKKLS